MAEKIHIMYPLESFACTKQTSSSDFELFLNLLYPVGPTDICFISLMRKEICSTPLLDLKVTETEFW